MYVYEFISPEGDTIRIYSNPESAIKAFKEHRELCPDCYPDIPTKYRWYHDSLQFKNYDTFDKWKAWGECNTINDNNVFCVYRSRVYD